MRFTIEQRDDIVVFTLKNPNLDSEISPQLKAELLILCQPDKKAILFDLSHVEYVDSTGLGALLLANRQLKDYDSVIALVGVKELVMKMLSISHIDSLFEYYDTVDQAIENLK